MKVKAAYLKNWLRGQVLLGVLVSLCMLVLFIPSPVKAAGGTPSSLSISTISQNCALLPVISRPGGRPLAARPNKSDNRGKGLLAHPVLSSPVHRLFISNLHGISNYLSSFDTVFKRQLQQAYRLLDIPPPAAMVSF